MRITDLRGQLEGARASVVQGDRAAAIAALDEALHALDSDRLLTTTEAAALLGIRSVNTVKLLCRTGHIRSVTRGNRAMIPLSEIERIHATEQVRNIRASDRLHDVAEALGNAEGLLPEELADLECSRPGRMPWQ